MSSNVKLRIQVTEADHSRGPVDAPLVLVEYGDYECPYCGRAHAVLERLRETLEGDLRFVFRHFPLTAMHPHALEAARAAEAAGRQGRFWEMHDTIYENQDRLEAEDLIGYATDLGLDIDRFTQDIRNPEIERRIGQDLYGGARSGVNGTPSFFINGYRFDGDWSYESLLSTLEAIRDQLGGRQMRKAG